jgi:hypothetical protein
MVEKKKANMVTGCSVTVSEGEFCGLTVISLERCLGVLDLGCFVS